MWVPYKSIAYGQLAQFSLQHEDLHSWNSSTSELGPWRKTRIQHPANEWLRDNEAPIENSAGCWRWRCGQVRQPLDGHGARRKQCLLQRFANHSSYVVLPKVFPSVSSILSVFLQFLSWRQRAAFYRFPSMSSILFLEFFTEAVFLFLDKWSWANTTGTALLRIARPSAKWLISIRRLSMANSAWKPSKNMILRYFGWQRRCRSQVNIVHNLWSSVTTTTIFCRLRQTNLPVRRSPSGT